MCGEVSSNRKPTYGDSLEKSFKENLIIDASLDDLLIIRQVDQHCESILGDCCVIFDQQLEISNWLERVALEQTRLSSAESNQVLGGCIASQIFVPLSIIRQCICYRSGESRCCHGEGTRRAGEMLVNLLNTTRTEITHFLDF
jgi:hypothetical protein